MKLRPSNILVVSLVLVSALIALCWARSYFVGDMVQCHRNTQLTGLADEQVGGTFSSGGGGIAIDWGSTCFQYADPQEAAKIRQRSGYVLDGRYRAHWYQNNSTWYTGTSGSHVLGFGFRSWSGSGPMSGMAVTFPWALPLAATAAYPALRAWKLWRRRHRYRSGACHSCGYDLRASKERCPECGTPIPPSPTG